MHIANKNTDKTVKEFICEEQSNMSKYQPETFCTGIPKPTEKAFWDYKYIKVSS